MTRIADQLFKAPEGTEVLAERAGTAYAPLDQLKQVLGKPSFDSEFPRYYREGERFTIGWVLSTPRGLAVLRDYRWNEPDEWTLAAQSPRAALWLAAFLRRLGIRASTRYKPPARNFERALANLT